MSARDRSPEQERRSSGPGLGLNGKEAEEFLALFREVVAERKRQQSPLRMWLMKLAAVVFGALLSAEALGGMSGCNRIVETTRAMDAHQAADDKQHAAEAQKWLDVTSHLAAQDIRLERIEGSQKRDSVLLRWLVKRAGGPVDDLPQQ